MNGDDTRDLAVEARSMITQHMTDCTKFRDDLQETLREFRADIKALYTRLALIVGGLIALGKVIDFGVKLIH